MIKVLVLDVNKQPLYPVRISHARMLLSQGKAAVFQRYPFTIILKEVLSQLTIEQLGLKMAPSTVVTTGKKLEMNFSQFPKRGRGT
ncbi:HNH endonuclease [Nostoc minutum NIES-26]|uniref:HNH endonuclease n=1 Tax=Nostoc minutum NIES-26 TaxID=1844469 RepID=A0A367QUF4_9NOSO|nr:RRXRR domain-containing protein [Dendronalium sp. ChiSLP03b]MDZ8203111.1 RRXRR domain-containing protein [Dendronalium sp. ChiSLP03b]RCJ26953.1 HNH endonuclease [Nostoc minutum NIES-26]